MTEEVQPLKVGVRVQPPALTLVYRRPPHPQPRLRVMPVRFLHKFGSVDKVLHDLQQHHSPFLDKVAEVRVEKMLRLLQEVGKGRPLGEAVQALTQEYSVDPDQDLNKLDDEQLLRKKKVMSDSFEKHRVQPGDPDYQYDKQVDFDAGSSKVEAGWDSAEEDFWS